MKGQYLRVEATLTNEKLKFDCRVESRPPITVDYVPPAGDGQGVTSLELLLISLATCFGSSVKVLLSGPMGRRVQSLHVWAEGARTDTHPTVFQSIRVHLSVAADALRGSELPGIAAQAERICPVYAMLKQAVPITIDCHLGVAGPAARAGDRHEVA